VIIAKTLTTNEFRGIRNLTLELGGGNFAVCGPNGTGKSGIVDALEFVLTGNISRLAGSGTGGLSVKEHGPHVDSRNKPQIASVTLTVHIPSLNKDASITRSVKDHKKPSIAPNDPDVHAVFEKVAMHPEFALSRREIIKYVLAEPGKHSREVQELLRLHEVERLRAIFQRIANSSDRDVTTLKSFRQESGAALQKALSLSKLDSTSILEAANERRVVLGLPPFTTLEANTSLKDGIATAGAKEQASKLLKSQAKSDIEDAKAKLSVLTSATFLSSTGKALADIAELAKDETFLREATRGSFIETALDIFDGHKCPVCDTAFSEQVFRERLQAKLLRYEEASKRRLETEKKLAPIIAELESTRISVTALARIGSKLAPAINTTELSSYGQEIEGYVRTLREFLPLELAGSTLAKVTKVPPESSQSLRLLELGVNELPDPSQLDASRDYLIVGQEKLEAYRGAALKLRTAEQRAATARVIFNSYAKTTTDALDGIYKAVEGTFTKLYRLINQDDEKDFQAHLNPSIGKLGLDVDFYGRGFFPPGAYHSEGHQDGMGLCHYLALMKHLAGDAFTFAVLDDVLMSVDAGHRREVSKMLREQFPTTQFILTTHDEIWLKHMKSVGLIEPKRFAQFRTWNVDTGPTQWDSRDVWEELADHVKGNRIRDGAALLRNYLEHFGKEACQALRASVEFRGDAQFTLGDVLPAAISKMKSHLRTGKAAAQAWKQVDVLESVTESEKIFSEAVSKSQVEQWQLNAAVHFNEWANLHANDFSPVVDAFTVLVAQFHCKHCHSIISATPGYGDAQTIKCACGKVSLNLAKKA
jgi:energy-coupling factor transporter ATP-binding protein EcfA2